MLRNQQITSVCPLFMHCLLSKVVILCIFEILFFKGISYPLYANFYFPLIAWHTKKKLPASACAAFEPNWLVVTPPEPAAAAAEAAAATAPPMAAQHANLWKPKRVECVRYYYLPFCVLFCEVFWLCFCCSYIKIHSFFVFVLLPLASELELVSCRVELRRCC